VGTDVVDRLFSIEPHGDDYFPGVCEDGRQVVMGLLCPHLVAYFFGADGKLLGDEHRLWQKAPPRFGTDGPYKIGDNDFQLALTKQLQDWRAEIGFQPQTISVRAFWDERHPVGIELLPEHLQDLDTADWFEDEDERQEYVTSREEWLAEGKYVWWWAKDYFVNADGEVESS
jgi:hypothetical protein